MISVNDIKELSKNIRKDVLKMTYKKKASFIGSAFSCADIMAVLYGAVMQYDKNDIENKNNDVLFLSKGHAASALYATLAEVGIIEKSRLVKEFNESGYKMGVHLKRNPKLGIISSSGSLGQGVGLCTGYALANKIQGYKGHCFVIVGDGECNEGSVWESLMFANKNNLDNFTFIIDRNRLQSYGHDEIVLNLGDMKSKVESFGLYTIEVDGHDVRELLDAFEKVKNSGRPSAIIANTIKGKGFSEFEDKTLWHYKWPEDEHYEAALAELENVGETL